MRDKVLAAIEAYSAGGTITRAISEAGLKSVTPFYAMLRKDPEVMALYEAAIKARSYALLDEAYEIGSDNDLDAKKARAQSEIRLKIAGLTNPDRFGDRVNVQHEVKPSLVAAIEQGKQRALRPPRDLENVIDAECIEVTNTSPLAAADDRSALPVVLAADGEPDPFAP